jgi:hypothetical protein
VSVDSTGSSGEKATTREQLSPAPRLAPQLEDSSNSKGADKALTLTDVTSSDDGFSTLKVFVMA